MEIFRVPLVYAIIIKTKEVYWLSSRKNYKILLFFLIIVYTYETNNSYYVDRL